MASRRYVKEPGANKGTYLPCPKCHEKVCVCIELYLKAALEVEGLPTPERQIKFCSTRRWSADFGYLDQRILIEVEGGGGIGRHTSATGYREDCVKYNSAILLGWRVFRFDKSLIAQGIAVKVIRAALEGTVYVPEFSTRNQTKKKRVPKTPENPKKDSKTHKNASKMLQKCSTESSIVRVGVSKPSARVADPNDPVEIARQAIRSSGHVHGHGVHVSVATATTPHQRQETT